MDVEIRAAEDTMNAYITDQIARDHLDHLLADAVIARRVRAVRQSRRAASRRTKTPARAHPTSRARAVVSNVVSRPVAAFQSWLAAGLL
jgi:hypothetical protein